jgi:hypothetical protein
MNPDPLPGELTELENSLRRRPVAQPTEGLRERVLRSTAQATLRPQPTQFGKWDSWSWAAIAAAVLIAMNLSMICASQAEYSMRSPPNVNGIDAELHAVQWIDSQQEGIFK